MTSELLKALAKRRSRDEDVFESAAVESSADAGAKAGSCARSANDESSVPPWLEGAVFIESAARVPVLMTLGKKVVAALRG